jgi:hypothetical protein
MHGLSGLSADRVDGVWHAAVDHRRSSLCGRFLPRGAEWITLDVSAALGIAGGARTLYDLIEVAAPTIAHGLCLPCRLRLERRSLDPCLPIEAHSSSE